MRLVFMGTPGIAVSCLDALLAAGHEVAAAYTRADKPQGRKRLLCAPPVKQRALEKGIPVFQPATMRKDPEAAARQLAALSPELVVVVAYGLLLPPQVLAVPPRGCINLHVSLLPKYRGAAPVQWAVINGERHTGVTVMRLDEGLDTGDVLAVRGLEIGREATAGEVLDEAAALGARLLADTVAQIAAGTARAAPQRGEASLAPALDKAAARLDFSRPAAELHNLARGCNPWPIAWFEAENGPVKLLRCEAAQDGRGGAGEVLSLAPLTVACGQGALVLRTVQPAGGRAMPGHAWAMGRRFRPGQNILRQSAILVEDDAI